MKIYTQKISEKKAHELYSDLITPDINVLEKSKSNGKDWRNNVLNILKNLESVFISVDLNYFEKPLESEESIAERKKIKKTKI